MNGIFKRALMMGLCSVCFTGLSASHAASFDCAKARTKVEKMICADPFISKLDGQLGKVYDKDLAKANPEQKKRLVTEERDWLKNMRDWCTTQTCFKHAYWQRLAELETFYMPHSPMYAKASDKAAAIQKILMTAPLSPSKLNGKECPGIFHAVKEMKGVRFVNPTIQAMSYGNPTLIPLRKRVAKMCRSEFPQGAPITFDYQCTGKPDRLDLDSANNALGGCTAFYGLPPFKVYKLTPEKTVGYDRYIFSFDAQYGPMNIPGMKPIWLAGGGLIDGILPNCGRGYPPIRIAGGPPFGPSYKSVIEYHEKYYILMVYRSLGSYWVELDPVSHYNPCDWYPISSNSGGK